MKKYTIIIFPIILLFIYIYSTMIAGAADQCDLGNVSTTTGGHEIDPEWHCACDPYIPLTFNDNNTPDTISNGEQNKITVFISDGCPPFKWGNPGNGYTWESGTSTYVRQNILIPPAGGTWGTDYDVVASFTITDSCKTQVTAEIRNTSGRWVGIGNLHTIGNISGPSNWCIPCSYYIEGKFRWFNCGTWRWYYWNYVGSVSYETGSGNPPLPPYDPLQFAQTFPGGCPTTYGSNDLLLGSDIWVNEWKCN